MVETNLCVCKRSKKADLCPYKITVDWLMLPEKDREFVLDQMTWLIRLRDPNEHSNKTNKSV
jgi:hypothetical protein